MNLKTMQENLPGITFISSFSINGSTEENIGFIIPTHFCIASNGEFIIADSLNNCLRVFSEKGDFQLNIGDGQLKSVWNVVSLPNGHLLVSDTSDANIKKFHITGEYVKSFQWSLPFMAPSGLAIDKSNNVLVSGKGPQVWIYNCDGQLQQVIQGNDKNIIPEWSQYLAVSGNNSVILSNETESSIKCYDFEGTCLFHFKITDFDIQSSPNGLCIDKNGNILIADRDGSNVIMLSNKGIYLGNILSYKDDIENPIALAFNKNNELIVLELGGDVKSFKYIL